MLFGRLVSLTINFAVQVLTVRFLSKTDYGAFAYALSMVSMGSSIALFGMDKALARFVPIYEEHGDYPKLFGTLILALGTIVGVGLGLVLLTFGFRSFLTQTFVNDPLSATLLIILISLSPLQALDNYFQGLFAIFSNPRAIFFRRYLLAPSLKLTAVLIVILSHSNVRYLAVGYLIGGAIGTASYLALMGQLFKKSNLLTHFRTKKIQLPGREIFGFSLPLLTTDVVLIVKTTIVVLFLESFKGPIEVATFKAVVPVAALNLVVIQSFKFLFTPLAARMYARGDRAGINNLYWQTATWISLFSFPIFATSFSYAHPLTILLFGSSYQQSGTILALLSLGNYFNAALGYNQYTLRVYGKVKYIVVIDVLSTVFSIGLSYWFIPRYGAFGAAISTFGTAILYNVFKQLGLLFGTDIKLFDWSYLKVYVSIATSATGLFLLQHFGTPSPIVGIIVIFIISVVLLRFNRRELNVFETFPELQRITFLRKLLGSAHK